ncbi:hypothetical protein SAICODRAFT_131059 [Saitoella complicata NRRL Y-17804]|nr:uncharacterized protein SAICODRAFT_131059 [Saitoella complicata NRRL Y-17804]ODQ52590.1 hypothetical protein SAICODRAFT_131059 [Saitoella complicata NRRL Y-17804]
MLDQNLPVYKFRRTLDQTATIISTFTPSSTPSSSSSSDYEVYSAHRLSRIHTRVLDPLIPSCIYADLTTPSPSSPKEKLITLRNPDLEVKFWNGHSVRFGWEFGFEGARWKWTRPNPLSLHGLVLSFRPGVKGTGRGKDDPPIDIAILEASYKSLPRGASVFKSATVQLLEHNLDRVGIQDRKGFEILVCTSACGLLEGWDPGCKGEEYGGLPEPVATDGEAQQLLQEREEARQTEDEEADTAAVRALLEREAEETRVERERQDAIETERIRLLLQEEDEKERMERARAEAEELERLRLLLEEEEQREWMAREREVEAETERLRLLYGSGTGAASHIPPPAPGPQHTMSGAGMDNVPAAYRPPPPFQMPETHEGTNVGDGAGGNERRSSGRWWKKITGTGSREAVV